MGGRAGLTMHSRARWSVRTVRGLAARWWSLIDNWQPSVPEMKFLGTKRRLLQSKEVKTWEVGLRIGAAFVLAKKSSSGSGGDGSSSSVRPHIRRAHWHSFWVGQRGEQTISLRWLPPILVNVEDIENLPAVIHPVVTSTESRETR